MDFVKSFEALYSMFQCTSLAFPTIYTEAVDHSNLPDIVDAFDKHPEYLGDTRFRNLVLGNRLLETIDPTTLGVHEQLLECILDLKAGIFLAKQTDSEIAWILVETTDTAIEHLSFMISGGQVIEEDYKLMTDALLRITMIIRSLKKYPDNQRMLHLRLPALQWKIEDIYRASGRSTGLDALYFFYYLMNNPVSSETLFGLTLHLNDAFIEKLVLFIWQWRRPEDGNIYWMQRERYSICQRRLLLLAAYPEMVSDAMAGELGDDCTHGLIYDSVFLRFIDYLEAEGQHHKSLILQKKLLRNAFYNRQIYRHLTAMLSPEDLASAKEELLPKNLDGAPGFLRQWFERAGIPFIFSMEEVRLFFRKMLLVYTKKAWQSIEDDEVREMSARAGELVLMNYRLKISLRPFLHYCSKLFATDLGKKAVLKDSIWKVLRGASPRVDLTENEIEVTILKGML